MEQLLRDTVDKNASDLHLSAGQPPRLRVDGDLTPMDYPVMNGDDVMTAVETVLSAEQKARFHAEHELDLACALADIGRFRVNVFMQNRGPGAVLRRIPTVIPTLEQLGAPPIFQQLCERERGLVLVTGPTGSGKSTTLAAMVDHINNTWDAHILTVEDPIEFVHQSKRCLVNQREVGPHTGSFANALKSALREDPDVILVGEMRDLETISLALTAAETGHLVFGTLHTSSAPKTIDRIIDVFPSGQQGQIRTMVSESLEAVIAQKLMKKRGGGRCAAHEILIGIPAVRNLIREAKLHQIPSAMQTGQAHGMQTMDAALAELTKKGLLERPAATLKASGEAMAAAGGH
jgi:twitching motility protein PilT